MLFKRKGGFIKSLIFLSFCLFSGFSFAQKPALVIDNNSGRVIGTTGNYSRANTRTIVEASTARMVNSADLTVRSATSGAVSSAKVPATISRTVPKATVLRNLLGRTKLLRLTPQGLVGGLILGEILTMLEDDGYQYDDASGEFLSSSEYLVRVYTIGNAGKIHLVKQRGMVSNLGISNYGVIVDQLCRDAWDVIKPSLPNYQRYRYLRYDGVETGSCVVALGNDERNFYSWDVIKNPNRLLTPAEYERIVSPLLQQRPEAILEAAQLPESEWSQPKVHVLPGTIVNSQPYTDPKDGKAKQARWQFYDCDDGQSCVQETLIDRPDLQPNSPEAPAPGNPPSNGNDTAPGNGDSAGNNAGSGSQSGNQGDQDKDDLCRKYPHIMACDEQPEPMDPGDLSLPQKTVQIDFQPENRFPTDGQCPAPVTFQIDIMGASKTFAWEFTQACEVASRLRYLIIALAWVVAGFFCIRTVSSSI